MKKQILENNEDFAKFINKAKNTLGVSECSDLVDVSEPTIDVWASGESYPYQSMRPFVQRVLSEAIQKAQKHENNHIS